MLQMFMRVGCFKSLCESCLSVELCSLCVCSVACFKCQKFSNVSISLVFQGCFIQHSFVVITHARLRQLRPVARPATQRVPEFGPMLSLNATSGSLEAQERKQCGPYNHSQLVVHLPMFVCAARSWTRRRTWCTCSRCQFAWLLQLLRNSTAWRACAAMV